MKIVICTPFISRPQGSIWTRLHYALGFQKLGHEVDIIEEIYHSTEDL